MLDDYKCPKCGNTKKFYETRTFSHGDGVEVEVEVSDDGKTVTDNGIVSWGPYTIIQIECAECGDKVKAYINFPTGYSYASTWKKQK